MDFKMFLWILAYIFICWLVADFMSGLYHWSEDRYAFTSFIVVGDFQNHHNNPLAFLEDGFFRRNGPVLVIGLLSGIGLLFLNPWLSLPFFMVAFSHQVHALSHSKGKNNSFVVLLQDVGILQHPKHHGQHHRNPYDCNYCIMTNYVNPVLEYVNLWYHLEGLLLKFGIKPKFPENYKRARKKGD